MAEIIIFPRRPRRRHWNWELIIALAANFFIIFAFGFLGWEIFRP